MAATSDEEMEKLLSLANQISNDFENGINEIQTLKSNFNAEINHRQSLELTCSTLRRENERLKNLHLETLNNLMLQLQHRENSHNVKEELQKLTTESLKIAEDHRKTVESLKRNHEEEIRVLEVQIGEISRQKSADEATIYLLHHELISLRNRLKDVEEKSRVEIEDLRDCIIVEQEEKKELSKKVRDLEKELLVSKTKAADQQFSSSDKQLDLLKQKMMKLRRENEALKKQLIASKQS
ncbi:protein At-4/1-like [Chenopodium quinoa]|uniref:protein At-4/1-like n=1 Tax=Chenopodium quinoa TaxID=63459 RepID=UPI000B772367|nr:protein At-4/1-like [Chenopodium quinoa]